MTVYTDEVLMAFADGALEEPSFSELASAIENDAGLAARVEALALGRDVAKQAFGPLEPVPFQLHRKVDIAIRRAEQGRAPLLALAAAASVAVVVALPIGWFAGQHSATTAPVLMAGSELGGEVTALLSTLPSGSELRLATGTQLRVIASFETAEGNLCRELEMTTAQTAAVVVGCRQADTWRVAFSTSSLPAGNGYAPASSLEALDAYLSAIGAGEPITGEAEALALRR